MSRNLAVIVLVVIILGMIFTMILNQTSIMRWIILSRLPHGLELCMVDTNECFRTGGCTIYRVDVYQPDAFFRSVFYRGEVGLGESYTRGEWSTSDLVGLMCFLIDNTPRLHSTYRIKSLQDDRQNISHHYNVGNDFYQSILTDPWHAYSCAIWRDASDTLSSAQKRKIDIITRKLQIQDGSTVLDIGCGWGRIANYIATTCRCRVVGLTLSTEQHRFCQESFPQTMVETRILNFVTDESPGVFDRIYSIGMFEHVRAVNYHTFFRNIRRSLGENGRFVLHSIINTDDSCGPVDLQDPSFVTTHIFPGGQIPRIEWIREAIRGTDLQIVHEEIFPGQHYAQTLAVWRQNLASSPPSSNDKTLFHRYMYYFSTCEALFRLGKMGVIHLVITPGVMHTIEHNFVYL